MKPFLTKRLLWLYVSRRKIRFALLPFALLLVTGCQPTGHCYQAQFPSWEAMPDHATITIAGIPAGKVSRQRKVKETQILVDFCLNKGIRLRKGTTAILRVSSPLGERYMALLPAPASASLLPDGTPIKGVSPPRIEDLGELLWPVTQAFPPERLKQLIDLLGRLPAEIANGPGLRQLNRLLVVSERMLQTDQKPITHLLRETDRLQHALTVLEKRFSDSNDKALRRRIQRVQRLVTRIRSIAESDISPLQNLASRAGELAATVTGEGHGLAITKQILQREGLSGTIFTRSLEQQQKDIANYPIHTTREP